MRGTGGLAGRGRELAEVSAVLGGGSGDDVLMVLGEAGIGKTRLVASAAERVRPGVWVVTGSCLPLSGPLPLLPVVDALRALSEVDDGRLVKAALADCPPFVMAELVRLLPELGQSEHPDAAPPGDDGWRRERLFDAVRHLVTRAGQLTPLALVVEDVHWADATTLDLLDYLLTGYRSIAVPVVMTARTDEPTSEPTSGPAHIPAWTSTRCVSSVRRLELAPLTAAETAEQIALLHNGPVEAGYARWVFSRSEGNPLFTEQLVTADRTDGADAVPPGVTSLLLERTRALSAQTRSVLAALAISDRPLEEAMLAKICRTSPEALRASLHDLLDRRLLRPPDPQDRLAPRHALLSEAIVGSLLPSERRDLHGRLAEQLIEHGDPNDAAAVAAHLQLAGRSEELLWQVRAGRRADTLFAYSASSVHWLRALELAADGDPGVVVEGTSRAEMYQAASRALDQLGDETRSWALADEARDRMAEFPDPIDRANAVRRAAAVRWTADPVSALPLLQTALDMYEQLPPSPGLVSTLQVMGAILHNQGTHPDDMELLGRAADVAQQIGLRAEFLEMSAVLASLHEGPEGMGEGAVRLEQLCAELTDEDEPEVHLWVAMARTDLLCRADRLDEAHAAGAPALARAADFGTERSLVASIVRSNVCWALVELGDVDEAARLVDPLTEGPPTINTRRDHEIRAQADLLRNRIPAALARWAQLHALPVQPLAWEADGRLLEADCRLWAGEPKQAADGLVETLGKILEATDGDIRNGPLMFLCGYLHVLAARAHADLVELAVASGDAAAAESAKAAVEVIIASLPRWRRDPFGDFPNLMHAEADRLSWEAELSRVHGRSDPELWDQAAQAWLAGRRPHRAAYARYRQAERLLADRTGRSAAAEPLRHAARLCRTHGPLSAAISTLARRANISLEPAAVDGAAAVQPPRDAAARPAAFNLTERELAVLRLLTEGRTNPEIGRALYISAKTASVHVSNILRKLDASSRTQAAAIAERARLLTDGD